MGCIHPNQKTKIASYPGIAIDFINIDLKFDFCKKTGLFTGYFLIV